MCASVLKLIYVRANPVGHLILLKCPLAGLNVTTKKPIENTLCKLPFGIVANSTTTIDSIQK